jgi:hypothetical protein
MLPLISSRCLSHREHETKFSFLIQKHFRRYPTHLKWRASVSKVQRKSLTFKPMQPTTHLDGGRADIAVRHQFSDIAEAVMNG